MKNSNEIREKLLVLLASDISSFYQNDTLDVDSSYYVVVEKIIGSDIVSEVSNKLISSGLKINILGPFGSDDRYYLSIGSYRSRNEAENAFTFIQPLFPNSELYYLDKGSRVNW